MYCVLFILKYCKASLSLSLSLSLYIYIYIYIYIYAQHLNIKRSLRSFLSKYIQ